MFKVNNKLLLTLDMFRTLLIVSTMKSILDGLVVKEEN